MGQWMGELMSEQTSGRGGMCLGVVWRPPATFFPLEALSLSCGALFFPLRLPPAPAEITGVGAGGAIVLEKKRS